MMQRILILLLPLLLGVVSYPSILLAAPSVWVESHSKSVARITFVECRTADACENELNRRKRVASGFLFKHQQDYLVVTALHAVIGRGDIFYHFHKAGGVKTATQIIAANANADIALLKLKSRPPDIKPLQARFGTSEGDQDIYVIGYSHSVGTPIESRGRSRVLGRTLGNLLPTPYKAPIAALGILDLESPVIGLDKALAPGDSGAPVFNRDGYVIGVGSGGIPNTGSYISWATPIDATLNVKVWRHDYSLKGNPVSPVMYSMAIDRVFYPNELLKEDRPIGNPILYYALRFETSEGLLNDYVREMAQVDDDFLYRISDSPTYFRGVPIRPTDPTFPGSAQATRYGPLMQDLSKLRIGLFCYSRPVFQRILAGEIGDRDAPRLLEIKYPLGNLIESISHSKVELSVTREFKIFLNLSSAQPIELQTFLPGVEVTKNYDRGNPQELVGGLCRVELDDKPGISSPYERALAQGVALFRFDLSELLTFDLFPPAVLPVANDASRMELWASLPPRPIFRSEDVNSVFKR